MANFALVLFDYDGCTTIVDTRKHPHATFSKAVQLHITWGGTRHLVEVLELSGSTSNLDTYEAEWSLSHRALRLDSEKERRIDNRTERLDGYLCVWPDEEAQGASEQLTINPSSSQTTGTASTRIKKTVPKTVSKTKTKTVSKTVPVKKATRKTKLVKARQSTNTRLPNATKSGNNGRIITILHEGSGETVAAAATPQRAANFREHLSEDESDLVDHHIRDHAAGRKTIATQTEKVIIIDSEEDLAKLIQRKEVQTEKEMFKSTDDKLNKIIDLLSNETNVSLKELLLSSARLSVSAMFPSPVINDRIASQVSTSRPSATELSSARLSVSAMFPSPVINDRIASQASTSRPYATELFPLCSPERNSSDTLPLRLPAKYATNDVVEDLERIDDCEEQQVTTLLETSTMVLDFQDAEIFVQSQQESEPPTIADTKQMAHLTTLTALPDMNISESFIESPTIAPLMPLSAYTPSHQHLPNTSTSTFIEIRSYEDITNVHKTDNIRINKDVVRTTKDCSNTVTQFGWSLAQKIFSPTELSNLNYFGRGKPAFSPRRKNALEEALFDTYGKRDGIVKVVGNAINTSLRGYRWRKKRSEAVQHFGDPSACSPNHTVQGPLMR